ncbi:MAG: LexA family protein [Desulfatibacillaceae bacterium]
MTTGDRIKKAREDKGLSQTELGKAAFPWLSDKSAQSKIKRIEKGQEPRAKELDAIARVLATPVTEFVQFENVAPAEFESYRRRLVPVISWVTAGEFAVAEDPWPMGFSGEADPVSPTKKVGPNAFGLKVRGKSMMPRYMEGDIIIVDPAIEALSGDPCVAKLSEEVTFKFFIRTQDEIRLRPMNDSYPDIVFPMDSNVEFHVIGKVVDHVPCPADLSSR